MKDYESAFSVTSKDLGEDARSRQFLTFYQREMVLYTRSNEGRPVEDYCLDHDLHPVFKACFPSGIPLLHTAWCSVLGGLVVVRMIWQSCSSGILAPPMRPGLRLKCVINLFVGVILDMLLMVIGADQLRQGIGDTLHQPARWSHL